jgi:hypothetical protein
MFKLIIHIFCQCALAGKIGNGRSIAGILVNLDMVDLGSLHLLGGIWIQLDQYAVIMRELLLFAIFVYELDFEI